jgi:ATP-dependent helicase/nuclease subunit A
MSGNEIKSAAPDPVTLKAQAEATDPANTVWVSANAGSGKTYVLARRVIRLMLEGAEPASLLCLTFTKAAAAEMSNRVFGLLGEWATLEEERLRESLREVTGALPSSRLVDRARQLFALALDTPGGLKIQTIHAFCESLLHQFPLEANVPGQFRALDGYEASQLIDEARRSVIAAASPVSGSESERTLVGERIEAFARLQALASQDAIEKGLEEIISRRQKISEWLSDGVAARFGELHERLGLQRGITIQDIVREAVDASQFEPACWKQIQAHCAAFNTGGVAKLEGQIDALLDCLSTRDTDGAWQLLLSMFLTAKREPLKQFAGSSKFTDGLAGLRDRFETEQTRLVAALDRIKTLEALEASEALFLIGEAILERYAALKQRRGLLDFDDLIERAANLLTRSEISAWIQYKLDLGIAHVLVDEAQDTSPLQWQIVNAITEEFFAGKGRREDGRQATVFVVGDEKQSIYSFQGADPAEFQAQRAILGRRSKGSGNELRPINLRLSFRSTEEVLSAVDQVFSVASNARGLGEDIRGHTAHRMQARGEVILWEPEIRENRERPEDWLEPVDRPSDAEIRLAMRIARTIGDWLEKGEKLPGRSNRIRPKDILILVRKRDRFARAIGRELKRLGIPTAGADRLLLSEHIFVEDMLALGRFALMSRDDLSLAALLKSPVFGFSEEELLKLANRRGKLTLWENLRRISLGGETPEPGPVVHEIDSGLRGRVSAAVDDLAWISASARSAPVFEFYAAIFARLDLRRTYLERLGNEVDDVMNAFLASAIDFGTSGEAGLTGFIEWLGTANPELKREIDTGTDEVRVITVHSAKGLEAPIVFLVDPGGPAYSANHAPKLIGLDDPGKPPFVWIPATSSRIAALQASYEAVQARAEEEYRRLLYVGMTRAADRLVICGYRRPSVNHEHWFSMVKSGLQTEAADKKRNGRLVEGDKDGDGNILSWRWEIEHPEARETPLEEKPAGLNDRDDGQLAGRLRLPVASEPHPPHPVSPSGVLDLFEVDTGETPVFASGSNLALEIGNAVHRLLQVLPGLEPDHRQAAAARFLAELAPGLPLEVHPGILSSVEAVMTAPELAFCFSHEARREVAIAGEVAIGSSTYNVRGQIDVLHAAELVVTIVDYKTNRAVPEESDSIPQAYVAQLALYRELARRIWPGREIRCAIVWTAAARLMTVPAGMMDASLDALARKPGERPS